MSNITVREALELPELQSLEVVAGESGLDREICDVTVMEVPDPVHWLKGGELLLTTFYGLREDEAAQVDLLVKVAPTVAGICFNPGTGTNLSPEIIAYADQLSLPLLRMPGDMPYARVIRAILQDILNRKAYLLSRSTDINSMLINTILNGAESREVVSTLAQLVKNPVALLDVSLNVVAEDPYYDGGNEYFKNGIPKLLELDIFHSPKPSEDYPSFAVLTVNEQQIRVGVKMVMIKSSVYGYLTVWEILSQFDEVDKYAIVHASTAIALDFIRKINLDEQRQKLINNLCDDLLTGQYISNESILKQAEMYGLDLTRLNLVIVIKADLVGFGAHGHYADMGMPCEGDETVLAVRKLVESKMADSLVACKEGEIIVVIGIGAEKKSKNVAVDLITDIDRLCKRSFGKDEYLISVGGVADHFSKLSQSYSQSKAALKMVRYISDNKKAIFFDELGIYRLLCEMPHTPEVKNYIEMVLPSNDDLDKSILETLEVFIECQNSYSAAGKMLYVHPNTVKYRINKAKEKWGEHIVLDNNCLDTLIALKLKRIFDHDLHF